MGFSKQLHSTLKILIIDNRKTGEGYKKAALCLLEIRSSFTHLLIATKTLTRGAQSLACHYVDSVLQGSVLTEVSNMKNGACLALSICAPCEVRFSCAPQCVTAPHR